MSFDFTKPPSQEIITTYKKPYLISLLNMFLTLIGFFSVLFTDLATPSNIGMSLALIVIAGFEFYSISKVKMAVALVLPILFSLLLFIIVPNLIFFYINSGLSIIAAVFGLIIYNRKKK